MTSTQDTTAQATKHCTICHTEAIEDFYKQHKHICRECLNAQNKARRESQQKEWEERRAKWEREHGETWEVSQAKRIAKEAEREEWREREQQAERLRAEWYATQPDRQCTACGIEKKATEYGSSTLVPSPDNAGMWVPGRLRTRCNLCHEAYREKNRQVNPLCPMCERPARHTHGGWLREYQGHCLDIIKVCCADCIPRFEALAETEQVALLRQAMIKTYGETAVIYSLQYDDTFHCHHIGRTKRLKRRMAEYRQYWDKPIIAYHVLEEIPFGPLSMERESRWMIHALKHGWPIDNFDRFTSEKGRALEEGYKARIIAESAHLEPLTCPFEEIAPLIRGCFGNITDMDIVHWLVSHH